MQHNQRKLWHALAVAMTLGLVTAAPALASPPPACSYTVTLIESPLMCGTTPEITVPRAINASGLVAGERYCSLGDHHPFLWSAKDGYTPLDSPPGAEATLVYGLNVHGEIAGFAGFPNSSGYLRKVTGQYLILTSGPGGNWSEAHGLNDASTVVGYWSNSFVGPYRAPCTWQDGALTDLSRYLPGPFGVCNAINSSGQITGWTGNSALSDGVAFILTGGRAVVLPPISGGITSDGLAINDRGDIAGTGKFASPPGGSHAFAYMDGRLIDLGTLPGKEHYAAHSINNHRVIVGGSSGDPPPSAFLWQDSVLRNLNDLIPPQPPYTITNAYSINDDGVIAARGFLGFPANGTLGFVLTPVYPSPADLSGDCHVNDSDLEQLLGAWGRCGDPRACPADLDHSGSVNGFDLAILLAAWG